MIIIIFLALLQLAQSQTEDCMAQWDQCEFAVCRISNCSTNSTRLTWNYKSLTMNLVQISMSDTLNIETESLSMNRVTVLSTIPQSLTVNISSKQLNIVDSNFTRLQVIYMQADSDIHLVDTTISTQRIAIFTKQSLYISGARLQISQRECRQLCSCVKNEACYPFSDTNMQFISILKQSLTSLDLQATLEYLQIPIYDLMPHMLTQNYTLAFVTLGDMNILSTHIDASVMGLYGENIVIDALSHLNAQGQGCQRDHGYGCGYEDWAVGVQLQCGASGASHGGSGGFPGAQHISDFVACTKLPPRSPYGSAMRPTLSGSGGGGKFGGSGGGVIFMETLNTTSLNGVIDVCGYNPFVEYQAEIISMTNFGSGSGGSIQLHTKYLDGEGSILANGGGASLKLQGNGGFGGGGRILINYTHWNSTQPTGHKVKVSASAGEIYPNIQQMLDQSKIDENQIYFQGSIATTPCLPGYSKSRNGQCVQCLQGYYKTMVGSQQCSQCVNENGRFNFSDSLQVDPICEVVGCLAAYSFLDNQCITAYEDVVRHLGGQNGIFFIWVSIVLLLLSAFVVIFRKRQKRSRGRFNYNSRSLLQEFDPSNLIVKRDESSAKPEFIVEDLPYHVRRIYLHGENIAQKPWTLAQDTQFGNKEIDPVVIETFIHNLNEMSRYSLLTRIFLRFLFYFHYPLYYMCLTQIKEYIYTRLTKIIVKSKMDTFKTNQTGLFIKFSSTPDYNLAYIDVLDYTQDALGWNNQTQFPVSLVLCGVGSFLQPLQVYCRDPLVRSLNLNFQNKRLFYQEQEDDSSEDEDKEEITSFDHFLQKFNSFARQIDFRQTQSYYLKAFMALIRFIESNNEEVFQANGVTIDVCVHFLANETKYPLSKSSIIMLSLKDEKELHKTLREIHYLKNYSDEYEIKYSINFDQLSGPIKHHLYDDQVILITQMDINQQIQAYRIYEDDREELNNLKQKMGRRLDYMQKPLLDSPFIRNNDTVKNEIRHQTYKHYFNKFMLHLQRCQSVSMSFFVRFRQKRISSKLLVTLILFFLVTQIAFAILYPISLFLQRKESQENGTSLTFLQLEILTQFFLFPLAWFFSPILMCVWLIQSVSAYGKKFLIMNYCAILSSLLVCLLGILQLIQGLTDDHISTQMTWINLIKIGLFANLNIMSYLGCLFLNHNDDIEGSDKS